MARRSFKLVGAKAERGGAAVALTNGGRDTVFLLACEVGDDSDKRGSRVSERGKGEGSAGPATGARAGPRSLRCGRGAGPAHADEERG